jgi:hypothetical protein
MTREEYELSKKVVLDKLNHQLKVGDLIICSVYSCTVAVYRVHKICKKKIIAERVESPKWLNYFYPNKVIKIKEDGISED